jgi:hypothetical protein
MSGLVALALILGVLVFAVAMVLFYEFAAVRRRDDDLETISSYWTRLHRGRLLFLVMLALALTGLYVFLIGDLVLELWQLTLEDRVAGLAALHHRHELPALLAELVEVALGHRPQHLLHVAGLVLPLRHVFSPCVQVDRKLLW